MSERWPASQSITPGRLAEQLHLLRRRGYRPVTFSEAVARPRGRVMAVTFDDGYRSGFDVARPLLAEMGVPATLFVPTDHIGVNGPVRWSGVEEWLAASTSASSSSWAGTRWPSWPATAGRSAATRARTAT